MGLVSSVPWPDSHLEFETRTIVAAQSRHKNKTNLNKNFVYASRKVTVI
jgi:hypothetical protein